MSALQFQIRAGCPDDATTIAALSVQVFLDTYATEGVLPYLARESFTEYSVEAFASRLHEPSRVFFLAEHSTALVGFAELQLLSRSAPNAPVEGAELIRLYVQPRFHRRGVGQQLIRAAEFSASAAGLRSVWLTAWEGNVNALAFYAAVGYQSVGSTQYSFQCTTVPNRVLAKHLSRSESVA